MFHCLNVKKSQKKNTVKNNIIINIVKDECSGGLSILSV